MVFTTAKFLLFFAAAVAVFYFVPLKYRSIVLLTANIVFYASSGIKYIPVLAAIVLFGYIFGRIIAVGRHTKLMLLISVTALVGLLFLYKYLDFALSLFGNRNTVFSLAAPLGISFYTLASVGYLVDVSRDAKQCEKNLLSYSLFITFFPQLLSGPIPRARKLIPQMCELSSYNYDNLRDGLMRMLIGAVKKLIIADNLCIVTDFYYTNYQGTSGARILIAVLFYSIQIYCDFSGYSDMAVGAAKCLGVTLDENFDSPYLARSIKGFWRRWHISLSSWFRDYLYIPLGGSRKGKLRTAVNTLIVFAVSGLWHGAALGYVVWGLLHGAMLDIENSVSPLVSGIKDNTLLRIADSVRVFILTTFAWIFFRAPSLSVAVSVIKKIFTEFGEIPKYIISDMELTETKMIAVFVFIVLLALYDILKDKINIMYYNAKTATRYAVAFMLMMSIYTFGAFGNSSFIYFNF